MSTDRDVTRIVRSWLEDGATALPDRVLDRVLDKVPATSQRSSWRPAGIADINNAARLAIAAAAVVVVAVGINLLPSSGGVGGPPTALPASTSPSPTATPRPTPDPLLPDLLEPGSFDLSTPRMRVHLTVPAGWSGDETRISLFPGHWTGSLFLAVTTHDISYVLADACSDEADVDLVEVGPTVEELAIALTNQTGIQRSGPVDVTLGGYPARKFVLNLLAACPERHGIWADASRTYGIGLTHGETATVYVVDVNGSRQVIWSAYMIGASAEHIAELEAITDSIEIEPVPGAGPLPGVADGGWLPIGRHALTVDGIPLSFSVPELLAERGWARYRGIYISKDTVGSQGAEGAIYWTAFPDGADTDPCADLLELTRAASISDLAAVVSTAPGTELVAGPVAATVGGRPAKHVVVTVRDDFGCDPGFFFTWDPAGGGPAWWTTNAGDTINVWIVNVDGKLLVIVGETTTDASARLEQEVRDIVDSIQFE